MPVYEYQCKSCEHSFNEFYKIDDRKIPTKIPCPLCGKSEIQQLISLSAVVDPFSLGKMKPTQAFQEKAKSLNRYYRKSIIKDVDK